MSLLGANCYSFWRGVWAVYLLLYLGLLLFWRERECVPRNLADCSLANYYPAWGTPAPLKGSHALFSSLWSHLPQVPYLVWQIWTHVLRGVSHCWPIYGAKSPSLCFWHPMLSVLTLQHVKTWAQVHGAGRGGLVPRGHWWRLVNWNSQNKTTAVLKMLWGLTDWSLSDCGEMEYYEVKLSQIIYP